VIRAVDKTSARVIALVAPGGFGKSIVARQIAECFIAHGTCDCAGVTTVKQFAMNVLVALNEIEPFRSPLLARSGVTLTREGDDGRAIWTLALQMFGRLSARSVLIFENVEHLRYPELRAALTAFLRERNPRCTVVLCSRPPLPIDCARIVPPNELLTIGVDRLRFNDDEIRQIFGHYNISIDSVADIARKTMRWPSMLTLAEAAMRGERSRNLPDAPLREMQEKLVGDIMYGLDAELLDAILILTRMNIITIADLHMAVPDRAYAIADELQQRVPLLIHDPVRGTLRAHPWLARALSTRYAQRADELTRSIGASYEAAKDWLAAVRAYIAVSDWKAVERCLDRVEFGTLTLKCTPEMELLADVGNAALVKYPRLWCATLPNRRFAVDAGDLLAEGRLLSVRRDDYAVELTFANAILAFDAGDRAHLDACVGWMRANAPGSVYAGALDLWYGGMLFGRFDHDAYERLCARAPELALDAVLAVDALGSHLRLNGNGFAIDEVFSKALARTRQMGDRRLSSRIRAQMIFEAWLRGHDEDVDRLMRDLESATLAYRHDPFTAFCSAVKNGNTEALHGRLTPQWRAIAALMIAGRACSPEQACAIAQYGLTQSDASLDPLARILCRVALVLLGKDLDGALLRESLTLAETIEAPLLREDLHVLCAKSGKLRMLAPIELRLAAYTGNRIVADLLSQRVWLGTRQMRLSERARDLLFTLALNARSVSSSELKRMLWPTLSDAKASNALKAAVHRLRAQLGDAPLIQSDGSGYSLSSETIVDIAPLLDALLLAEGKNGIDDGLVRRLSAAAALLSERITRRRRRYYAHLQRRIVNVLGVHAVENGRYGLARKYATMMFELDPYDERAYALVITAMKRSGDISAAGGAYAAYRNAMAEAGIQSNSSLDELVLVPAINLRQVGE